MYVSAASNWKLTVHVATLFWGSVMSVTLSAFCAFDKPAIASIAMIENKIFFILSEIILLSNFIKLFGSIVYYCGSFLVVS